ncbi:hypothetical protein MSAN_02055800 [Mycena sanguinolenta]|uniref:Uncharacterized protein n=1 Tax=Mycena sanguinolenta TaxID=230812 RepID=A0A8H6XJE3_9AGAR|nr:hypothetical protein MSAN_02055800 [Mycena sanguinolenta]
MTEQLNSHSRRQLQIVGTGRTDDWLPNMIFAANAMAAAAEFVPIPCVRAAFSAVVAFLETVNKVKRNREDLKDLCASTLEIIEILQEEMRAHGEVGVIRLNALLENFISFLQFLRTSLETLLQRRPGFRGRFHEIFGASRIGEEILRYRMRINELRSNFLLMATINTNLNVIRIQNSVSPSHGLPRETGFRNVALGDINLLYETEMGNKVRKLKIFVARISGETSTMTVAKYEDNADLENDLNMYSNLRHPNVWQLFGISIAPALRALIFHGELIPLPVYRQFHRPQSDLSWACIETMLFGQFKECSRYHRWSNGDNGEGVDATICVKRDPIGICLTMLDSYSVDGVPPRERTLSRWHAAYFSHRSAPTNTQTISNIITSNTPLKEWAERLTWNQFFALLTPVWFPDFLPWTGETQLFLGNVIAPVSSSPVAYIPIDSTVLLKGWTVGWPFESSLGHICTPGNDSVWQRFNFPAGSFKAVAIETTIPFISYIEFEKTRTDILDTSWLTQANACIGGPISEGKHGYGVINTVGCGIKVDSGFEGLHPDGIAQVVHLFLAPISVKYEGSRVTFDYSAPDGFYWTLDSAGTNRLSPEECDSLGIPRLKFYLLKAANTWHEYHYAAIREFFRAKGFDPYGYDVAKLLGLPLVETWSAQIFSTHAHSHWISRRFR